MQTPTQNPLKRESIGPDLLEPLNIRIHQDPVRIKIKIFQVGPKFVISVYIDLFTKCCTRALAWAEFVESP